MKGRLIATLAVLGCCLLAASPAWAQRGGRGRGRLFGNNNNNNGPNNNWPNNNWPGGRNQREPSSEAVVKFVGKGTESSGGLKVTTVTVTPPLGATAAPPFGGPPRILTVQDKDRAPDKYSPDPAIMEVLKKLHADDYVKITFSTVNGVSTLSNIAPYPLKPGEDEPDSYVFVGSSEELVGKDRFTGVELSKFEVSDTVLVPKRRNAQGKMADDESVTKVLGDLQAGDVVTVETYRSAQDTMLKSIARWQRATRAEFVALVQTAGAKDEQGVEVTIGGAHRVLLLPGVAGDSGKSLPDPKLAAAARQFKPGDPVEVKFRVDGEKNYLTQIAVGKKLPPPADKDSKTAEVDKKDPAPAKE